MSTENATLTPQQISPATMFGNIDTIREQIQEKFRQREQAENAPLPKKEAFLVWKARVEKMASEGQVHFEIVAGSGIYPDTTFFSPLMGDGFKVGDTDRVQLNTASGVIAYLLKDKLLELGNKAIEGNYQNKGVTVASGDRKSTLAKFDDDFFALECQEESLIEQAETAGLVVFRRADATPEAVLGIPRKATLPWDWYSEKYERVLAIAEGGRAEVDRVRDLAHEARQELQSIQSSVNGYYNKKDIPKRLKEQLEVAKSKLANRNKMMSEAHEIIGQKSALANVLEEYVQKHKKQQPLGDDSPIDEANQPVYTDPFKRAGIR